MTNVNFDPDNTLAGGLYSLTPREVINLGMSLCASVEAEVGADGWHGSVWPGNVTYIDGAAAIGPKNEQHISQISPDALEFISPEQFWSGACSAACDVYSIGLILYTALNGGVMPFFAPDSEHTPEDRATALQSRMKGADLPYPKTAGRELGAIIIKAISFKAEDRFKTPGELRAALQGLPEDATVPAVAPVVRLTPEEVEAAHSSYKVDKNFEKTTPVKPPKPKKPAKHVDEDMDAKKFRMNRSNPLLIPAIIIVIAVIVAIVLLLKSCSNSDIPDIPVVTPNTAPVSDALVTPSGSEPVSEVSPDVSAEPTVEPSPDVTEPVVTPEPAEPTFEIYVEDVTWEEASAACEAKGGHLATVKNQEDMDNLIAIAEKAGAQFIWLGAYRGSDAQWHYVTGETMDFAVWDEGQPSVFDTDGSSENYLLMWYRKALGKWTFNDTRNDPISIIPATYSGKTAYICEFD